MLYGRSVEDAVPKDCDVRAHRDVMECLDYSVLESKCSIVAMDLTQAENDYGQLPAMASELEHATAMC